MESSTGTLAVVILAAGRATRFKSQRVPSKVLYPVAGIPMIEHIFRLVQRLDPKQTVIVVSPEVRDALLKRFGNLYEYVVQEEALGTGDALSTAMPLLDESVDRLLVLPGDVPLVTEEALWVLLRSILGVDAAVLTFEPPNPRGYGRIIRDEERRLVSRIVEESDAEPEQRAISEVNSGVYALERRWAESGLERVSRECGAENRKGEYYLTDIVRFLRTAPVLHQPPEDLMGINDRSQLTLAEDLMQKRIIAAHAHAGVTFVRAETTYVEASVRIGEDSTIYPGCVLRGDTAIGESCEIGPMCYLEDCRVGDRNRVVYAHLVKVHSEQDVKIGPFANLRPGTYLSESVKVGSFVELKEAHIGSGSKVPHLTYLGDSEVGRNVNIGAGTITCNYDGFAKYRTVIEDDAFIGTNNAIIAPRRIGKGAYTAAGSTINQDVPPGSLAVARGHQVNKEGYVKRMRERKAQAPGDEESPSNEESPPLTDAHDSEERT